MRTMVLSLLFASAVVYAQAPAQPPADGPKFEVVSIKRNISRATSMSMNQRPDGGFTMVNRPAQLIISLAYPAAEIVGLPAWATSDRYDVAATAALTRPTPDGRRSLLRALLSDRFNLAAEN